MGGNTYHRKSFTRQELVDLVQFAISNPLVSLRNHDIIYNNEKRWVSDLARLMDSTSLKEFRYLIATVNNSPKCDNCSAALLADSFTGSKFRKYCPKCTTDYVWAKSENLDKDELIARGKAITNSKLNFYQTSIGKQVAESIGVKNSVAMREFNQTPAGKVNIEKSRLLNRKTMKAKILSGEFTPNSNNRNTHWNSTFNGKCYRSSWEAVYQSHYPDDIHESLRIPYVYNNIDYIYIVDFVNHTNKTATEIKPIELCNHPKFIAKLAALNEWGIHNGYSVNLVTLEKLQNMGEPSDLSKFDSKTQSKINKIYAKIKN